MRQCELCQSHPQTRNNFREAAMSRKVNWETLPCGYECEVLGKTVAQSIAENHWLDEEHQAPARCQYATVLDELAIPNRPCQGRKVLCAHPTAGLGSVPEKRCGEKACKHFTA